ncbi:MAG: radical SAM protein [Xanthobacteraceae bacterium]|nr:radical SAM protein [Xanthobacteraceae bacterium]
MRTFEQRHPPLLQTVSMPMGILYLAATLERDLPGVGIDIVDFAKLYRELCDNKQPMFGSFEMFCAKIFRAEVRSPPDLIGISVLFSTAHKSTLRIAEVCKSIWPEAPVVVGGMHATNAAAQLLDNPAVDYVFRGEGEAVVADLVLAPSTDIPGVVGRDDVNSKQSAPLIYDLDTIPHPAWHLIPMREYVFAANSRARNLNKIEQDGAATIVTTRGCPFRCTFCASWTVHGREMRYRSKENVIEELRILRDRYDVNTVIPEDDLFTVKKARFVDLAAAIETEFRGDFHFQFPNGLSVATLDADVIVAMKRMGMTVANIAIESGSEFVQRKIIKKNVDLDRARNVVSECQRQGLVVRAYFIVGFPGETREQMQETVDFAASLEADWAIINPAVPLAGTEMYDQLMARGDIDASFNWDESFFQERKYDTAEIGAQELKDFAYGANLRINFFENYNLRAGRYTKAVELFRDILKVYPGHLAAQICLASALRKLGSVSEADEAAALAQDLVVRGEPIAVEQLARHPQLFPSFTAAPHVALDASWPRGGMPTAARAAI